MSRRIDHTERISESFNALVPDAQPRMLAELFTRLNHQQCHEAMQLMRFWQEHDGQIGPAEPKATRRRRKEAAAPLLEAAHAE